MKENLRQINESLTLYNRPLLQRKPKPATKDEFDREHRNLIKERYSEIKEGGKAIHQMAKDTNKVLRVSNASNDWRSYIDFVNNVVVDGLSKIVYTSLDYLFEQLDTATSSRDDRLPMIEVKLDLASIKIDAEMSHNGKTRRDEVRFIPPLESSDGKGK